MAVADDSLRPVLPDMLHPGLMDLLQACFSSEPEQRPSFAMVRAWLHQTAAVLRRNAICVMLQASSLGFGGL